MSIETPNAGAVAPSPLPVAQPPSRLGKVKAKLDNLTAVVTVVGGIGAMCVTGITATQGGFQSIWDRVTSISDTQSQLNALSEDLKAMKKADEAALVTTLEDRKKAEDEARRLQTQIADGIRKGEDIGRLQDRLRAAEDKISEMKGALAVLLGKGPSQ